MITETQLQEAQLQSKTEKERATKLVTQVISQVRFYPEKYAVFLKALEESDLPQKILRDVHKRYEQSNKQSKVISLVSMHS